MSDMTKHELDNLKADDRKHEWDREGELDERDVCIAQKITELFMGLDRNEIFAAVVQPGDITETPSGVQVVYTNHRGETIRRLITPLRIRWGTTEHHPVHQWLLDCFDHNRDVFRTYILDDCDFTRST